MTLEKWIIHPGETRVIDIETVRKLKVGLIGGKIDVIAHDEPGARIEVHGVTSKDLTHRGRRRRRSRSTTRSCAGTTSSRCSATSARQRRRPRSASLVPRDVALKLGVV